MKIGILALQGSIIEHINSLKLLQSKYDFEIVEAKYKKQLEEIDALILPGGESTTISKLLNDFDLTDTIIKRVKNGMPIFGTCAGMILLAKEIENEPAHLKLMDIVVKRNGYGSQLDSFRKDEIVDDISSNALPLIFIRAPFVVKTSDNVQILKKIDDKIVAVRQDNMLAVSFHTELTDNIDLHEYFIKMIK